MSRENEMVMSLHMVAVVLVVVSVYASIIVREKEVVQLPATTITSQIQYDVSKCKPCVCKENNGSIVAVCTSRHLSSIPNISIAANISVLLMDSNHISQLEEGCLSKYINLVQLNLAFNNISMIHVAAFLNLHKLQVLNLTKNQLQYTHSIFKSNIFKPLHTLKMLSLNRNSQRYAKNPSYPDKSLSDLVSLKELYLDGLTNQSFGEGFSKLTNLTHLSLAGHNKHKHGDVIGLFNTTFTHVTHLTSLNLSRCNIQYIEPAAFAPLRSSLQVLDLSYNMKLNFNMLFNGSFGLQFSSLRVFNISYIVGPHQQCVVISRDNFKYMRNTQIEEIYADGNRIEFFENRALYLLPSSLRKISMKSSWLAVGMYINQTRCLENLTEIDLSGLSGRRSLPTPDYLQAVNSQHCSEDEDDEATCNMPANIIDNNIGNMITTTLDKLTNNFILIINVPANLKILKYTFEGLAFSLSEMRMSNNSLENVNLSYNILTSWYGPIYGMNKIKYLDLSHNIASRAKPTFFQNFPSLIMLNISNNLLNNPISNDSNGDLFKQLTSLKILDLSANNLQRLPKDIFKGLLSLQVLELSKNNLYYVHMHVKHMSNLQKIDFSHNKIRWLPRALRAELDSLVVTQNHNVTIDLSYNPISCECPDLHFLKWMQNSQVKQENMVHYYCLNSTGHTNNLTDLHIVVDALEASCANYKVLALASLGAVLFSMFVLSAAVIRMHRWKLWYWYHAICIKFKDRHSHCDNMQDRFQYGAFISYAEEDKHFVEEMMNVVDEREGNKLNIHHRDFSLGKPIASNIVNAVMRSRKTVLVLSRNFINSTWCIFEMKMAKEESKHTGRDVLLVITIEDIPGEIIPMEILHLLQSNSHLEYQPDGSSEIFWQRFVNAINRS